jgi:hypothetical protein
MQGYLMEIDYGMHVRQRLEVRFDGIDCSYLDYRIEVLFGDPEVADYLLNEVRIGEDVVLVDEDSGITFAIAVYTDSIYIKTVYNAYGQGAFRVGEKQQILRYAEKMGFRTERFEKKRRSAHV